MRYLRLFAVLALLALVLTACGGSDEGADDGSGDDSQPGVTIQTDDGEVSISGGDGDDDVTINVESEDGTAVITGGESVPDGFPLPIHPDCTVVAGTTIQAPQGEMMMVTLEMPADKAEDVSDFYEEAFEDIGMMVIRTSGTNPDGSMILLSAVDDGGADRGASCIIDIQAETATAIISIGSDS